MWRRGMGMGGGWGRGWGAPPPGQMPSLPPPKPGALRVVASTDDDRGLDATISFRFARAPYMTVVDIVRGEVVSVQSVPNALAGGMRGVGVAVGQWLISIGAKAVLAPHLGPNIQMVLSSAGIRAYPARPGTRVIDALRGAGLVR